MGQIVGPFSSHGSWAICIRNLWTAHVHFCKIRRSLSPVASAGDCTQLTTLLLLEYTACPQQDCPLFVRHSKIAHATCDVVRGLWSLSEGSVRRDRRWNANGGSVGQFLNKAGSAGRVKAEVVGEVVDNDYNFEKLLFLLFFVQQMCGLPLRLRIFAKCSDGLTLVFHLRAFLNVIVTGLQVTSTFQLGDRNKVLSCHPSPLALLARNVYFSCSRLRKFGFLSRRSSCSERLSLMFLPHISAIGTLQLL